MYVGPVIQFSGLKPPASSCTSTEPSAFRMRRRTASGKTAVRRPVYRTSQRATSRRIARTLMSVSDMSPPAANDARMTASSDECRVTLPHEAKENR